MENLTIEQELANLTADHAAQAALLTEETGKVAALTATVGTLTTERDTAQAKVTELETAVTALTAERDAASAKVTEITKANDDFETKVLAAAARIAAASGTSAPLAVTGKGKDSAEPITRAQLNEMTPAAVMDYFRNGGRVTE